ncbi:hypothetical protein ACQP1P_23715 [Dactylosporangium sp. CA-052675]|uniref:hypothetical protein n=1 Tax=Dactylosporangium sp. CA-052675 TaxID=3239927 RepID=UPI003D8DD16C
MAAVSAVIVIGGGVAVAQAASDSNATQSQGQGGGRGPGGQGFPGGGQGFPGGPGNQNGPNDQNGQDPRGNRGAFGAQGGGFGRGGMTTLGGALHGDFVVKGSNGQYVTERLQTGTVTAVSATSITAKSEDGFSTTFAVGEATKVNNGASTIADVKTGATVTVIGTVSGSTATATEITDVSLLRQGNGGNGQRPANPRPTKTT